MMLLMMMMMLMMMLMSLLFARVAALGRNAMLGKFRRQKNPPVASAPLLILTDASSTALYDYIRGQTYKRDAKEARGTAPPRPTWTGLGGHMCSNCARARSLPFSCSCWRNHYA